MSAASYWRAGRAALSKAVRDRISPAAGRLAQPNAISLTSIARQRGGTRAASVGIETLQQPSYERVPILHEEPKAMLAEMPELYLSGGPGGPSETGDFSLVTGVALDEPIVVEDPTAEATAAPVVQSMQEGDAGVRFAQLDNGVRVVAVDRHGLCASLGLFVNAGSRYEDTVSASMPHMLELMAFRSTAHLSHIRTLKTLEQLGAAASCRVGREDILYQIDTLREYVPVVLPLMLANVLCPSLLPEEVQAAHEHVLEVQQNLEENTESLLSELLHIHAYGGKSLGNTLYAEEKDLANFTAEKLRDYIKKRCTPDEMIVVGVNTDFDELCKWTARSFAEHGANQAKPSSAAKPLLTATYTGGDFRLARENPLCHLMLGWEVEGGWNGTHLASITVLQMFLGGGGSFSTGGPGKGMHTRLYTDVLNRHHWVESCQASSVMYTDSGLFTIYSTVVPEAADKFVLVLARIFSGLTRITEEELQRAKNALKSSIHMNLEMRAVMVEDIGRQLVLAGKVGTAQEFGRMVDAVTADDLRSTLWHCLASRPTVVAYGAIERLPAYDKIQQQLSLNLPKRTPSPVSDAGSPAV